MYLFYHYLKKILKCLCPLIYNSKQCTIVIERTRRREINELRTFFCIKLSYVYLFLMTPDDELSQSLRVIVTMLIYILVSAIHRIQLNYTKDNLVFYEVKCY